MQRDVLDTCLTSAGIGVRPFAAASRLCACQPVCLGGLHLLPIVMSKTKIFPSTHLTLGVAFRLWPYHPELRVPCYLRLPPAQHRTGNVPVRPQVDAARRPDPLPLPGCGPHLPRVTEFTPAGWQQAAVSALTWDPLS